jgi:hypothetical protein
VAVVVDLNLQHQVAFVYFLTQDCLAISGFPRAPRCFASIAARLDLGDP